ncbi:bZIP transcription factor family protein [Rhynchospora pubera]|uniref:BZIP transcription factor family protein n=1 Tax=Rhynchospora pubera TaxID=906938 RepID=A0AAV8CAK0_9POAL|nr:bZIP transcription factor family protein [Rhynchospora pubera]
MLAFLSSRQIIEKDNMHPSRLSDLVALDQSTGLRIEDLANLNMYALINQKSNTQTGAMGPLQFSSFNTTAASSVARDGPQPLHQQIGAQPNLAPMSGSGNINNWVDSNMVDTSPRTDTSTDEERNIQLEQGHVAIVGGSESSERSKDKSDQKTLRRLAQNREAARKSRLRKKAYVQQLESSRLKLTKLEQDVQRARQQGVFISSSGDQAHSGGGNGALAFDMEYARWMEEQNKQINELRAALHAHASDADLHTLVEGIISHYDEIFKLKGIAAKADVFHMLSGMWKTPAERCFLWLGGFRSSELLKLLATQLEPLTDQQLEGICNLQQSSLQAEDALSQGMEALQQSLAETLASGSSRPVGSSENVANYMGQMAMAMGKLGTIESFLRQADNLRQQTLQQLYRILTTRQSARAFLAIHDYFSRLRALSSLWLARPQE